MLTKVQAVNLYFNQRLMLEFSSIIFLQLSEIQTKYKTYYVKFMGFNMQVFTF